MNSKINLKAHSKSTQKSLIVFKLGKHVYTWKTHLFSKESSPFIIIVEKHAYFLSLIILRATFGRCLWNDGKKKVIKTNTLITHISNQKCSHIRNQDQKTTVKTHWRTKNHDEETKKKTHMEEDIELGDKKPRWGLRKKNLKIKNINRCINQRISLPKATTVKKWINTIRLMN